MTASRVISPRSRDLISGALVLAFAALFVHTLITTRDWVRRPFPGFLLLDNLLVASLTFPGWAGVEGGVQFDDVVLAVDGRPVSGGREVNAHVAGRTPGTMVAYTLVRDGRDLIVTAPVAEFSLLDWTMLVPAIMLFGLSYFGIGAAVFFVKPNEGAARAFLIQAVVVGLTLATVPAFIISHHPLGALHLFVLPLVGPSQALLGLYFPRPHPWRRYLLPIIVLSALPLLYCYLHYFPEVMTFMKLDLAMITTTAGYGPLCIALMASSFLASPNLVTRQKAKIVIAGFSLALIGCAVFVIGITVLKITALFWALPIALMAFPAGIAYAIIKHNLFDVDFLIHRATSFLVVSAAALAMIIVLTTLLSLLLQAVLFERASQAAAVLSTVIIMLPARSLFRRVESFINRRFFRETYEYRSTIRQAAGMLASVVEMKPLAERMLAAVRDAIKIERGLIVLRDKESGEWEVVAASGFDSGPEWDLPPGHPLLAYLETERKPVHITEVLDRKKFAREREAMLGPLERMGLVLLAPVIFERRLTGVLGLGPKRSGAWYSSEDGDLIATLMAQAAVSIENARKVEDLKKMVALETGYRELQRLDEMKDNLLHMVSHDLRTPMTGIIGYAYLLHEGAGKLAPGVMREYLSVIIKEGERLTRLINDLLDLQRFEAGRMELELTDLDLVSLLQESARVFAINMENQGLRFESELPRETVPVVGHKDRLEQAVTNLLSNAIKFSRPGGRVELRAERGMAHGSGEEVKVSVSDTGIGVAPEYQDGLFDKFRQAQRRMEFQGEGSGLGLALVKEIIQYHRGRVGFQSRPGQGSTFYFFLPVKPPGPKPPGSGL